MKSKLSEVFELSEAMIHHYTKPLQCDPKTTSLMIPGMTQQTLYQKDWNFSTHLRYYLYFIEHRWYMINVNV